MQSALRNLVRGTIKGPRRDLSIWMPPFVQLWISGFGRRQVWLSDSIYPLLFKYFHPLFCRTITRSWAPKTNNNYGAVENSPLSKGRQKLDALAFLISFVYPICAFTAFLLLLMGGGTCVACFKTSAQARKNRNAFEDIAGGSTICFFVLGKMGLHEGGDSPAREQRFIARGLLFPFFSIGVHFVRTCLVKRVFGFFFFHFRVPPIGTAIF